MVMSYVGTLQNAIVMADFEDIRRHGWTSTSANGQLGKTATILIFKVKFEPPARVRPPRHA